jgi:hypothetical protein
MKLLKYALLFLTTAVFFAACQKEYSIENGGLKLPVGNWEFSNGTAQYTGNMDTAYISSSTGATKQLHLLGTATTGGQNFNMVLYADSFKVGTYKASLFQATFEYTTTAKTLYEAGQLVGEFTVNITTINSSLVIGTFSGSAKDTANQVISLTNGKFKATFAGAATVPSSTGVLGDSSGNCKPVVLNGTYTQGIAVTAANTAQLQVVVAVAGPYSITTNSVNGVTFSAAGTFSTTGSQTVALTASGMPLLAGEQVYTVSYGNSQCAFKVTYLPGTAPANDYLPLTVNSFWNYGVSDSPGDTTFKKVIAYTPSILGNTYNTVIQAPDPNSTADDSAYFRKANGIYYQLVDFSALFSFDKPVVQELIILKDNVPVNTTWQSANIAGTIGGIPFTGYVKMTLIAKAVPVTQGNLNFSDVIKVKYEFFANGSTIVIQTQERWFAKGVGEIFTSVSNGVTSVDFVVGSYKIS